ncbi:MAG: hypothetical protein U5O39_05700 [Gammaproteobacteria bacterium]|nr:hypothetical protein [Gammaproteobacteria bacterium]
MLEETDLVFIDPIGTGYRRPLSGEEANPDEFFSFRRDLDSVGEFIRLYTTRNRRWSSPKFLIGESYGTTRASGLAGTLQDRHGLYLNGVMLVFRRAELPDPALQGRERSTVHALSAELRNHGATSR